MHAKKPLYAALSLLSAAAICACTPNAARTELVDGVEDSDDLRTDTDMSRPQDAGDNGLDDGSLDAIADSQDSSPADAEDATAEDALTGDADAAEVPPNLDATDGDTSSDDTADIDPDACPVMAAMEAATAAIATPSFVRQVDLASLPTWPAGSCPNLVLRVELTNCPVAVGRPFDILWWTEAHGWFSPPFVLDHNDPASCEIVTTLTASQADLNTVDRPPWSNSWWRGPFAESDIAMTQLVRIPPAATVGAAVAVRLVDFPDVEADRYYSCEQTNFAPEARCAACDEFGSGEIALIACRGLTYEFGVFWRLGWDEVLNLRPAPIVENGWTISPYLELGPMEDFGQYPPSCFWFVARDDDGNFVPNVRPGLYLDMACSYHESCFESVIGPGPLCENIREDMLP